MTLITGIFGMNVAGLPGTPDVGAGADAFWWTMLLLVASGAVTLGALFSMKLF
jgi:zinc transporter